MHCSALAPFDCISKRLYVVVSSATEGELAALCYNAQQACAFRLTLEDLGWPQPATTIEVDNKCAIGIANEINKEKRSKAMDRRFFWIRDRIKQGQFLIHWAPVMYY